MKAIFLAVIVSILAPSSVLCDHWALLVAGSNTYTNYRHQADVCHAYHVMHNHGIPDDRIVVMMYDDIAHSPQNPFPGNIINEPDGPNVYPGVLKDYTGKDVNPDVFFAVLSGDEEKVESLVGRKSKVIKSGAADNVFVYFADHGAPGLIGFPHNEVLHAEDLNKVILNMHQNNQYKRLVFYVEACESGSMFDGLLGKDINVYATTAANPHEPSVAYYWDKKRDAYLGDLYSINWLQDSDAENLNKETLNHQFQLVKKETNLSHVKEYGDLTIGQEFIGEFQGNESSTVLSFRSENNFRKVYAARKDAIPSHLVPIDTLRRIAESSQGRGKVEAMQAFQGLLKRNKQTNKFFETIANVASNVPRIYQQLLKKHVKFTDFKCYRQGIETVKVACPGLNLTNNDIAMRNLRVLANVCELENIPQERIMQVIEAVAQKSPICSS